MELTEVFSSFFTATLIVLSIAVVFYAFIETTGERALDWLAGRDAGLLQSRVEPGRPGRRARARGGASPEAGRERRHHRRYRMGLMGTLHPDADSRPGNLCDILDISATGARIRPVDPLSPSDGIALGLERFGLLPARVVWRRDDEVGLSFEQAPARIAYTMRGLLPLPSGAR